MGLARPKVAMAPTSDHRPNRPWVLRMTWRDLLFLHLPIAAEAVQETLPAGLEVDTYGGTAWIGVVPFVMSGVAPRGFPSLPGVSRFPEFNVRTYVRHQGRSGVWFYSLDAASRFGVRAARRFFRLPYFDARMSVQAEGGEGDRPRVVRYRSRRTHRGEPPASFEATVRESGPAERAAPGSLVEWLTERYCLYSASPSGRLFRGEVAHEPWRLHPVEAEIAEDSLIRAAGFDLTTAAGARGGVAPIAHFSRELSVVAWWLRSLGKPVPSS